MLDEKPAPRGVRDRVLQLRAMPSFDTLDEDALVLMAEDARVRVFKPGDRLLEGGKPVDSIFVVTDGCVEVTHEGSGKTEIREGEVGLVPVLAGDARGLDAVARQLTTTLELPADAMLRNMTESFAITRNIVRRLARALLARRGHLPQAPEGSSPVDVGLWRTRPLTLVEKLLLLRATPLGQIANLDAAAEMARAMVEVQVEPNTPLWAAGDPAPYWMRIEYGRVRCTAADGQTALVGAGFVLGILDGLADLPRSYDALAETRLIVQRMDVAGQLALMETHTLVAAQMTKFLARSVLEE